MTLSHKKTSGLYELIVLIPLQKLRARLGSCKIGLSPPVILYYRSFQRSTSVVVLIVLCLGV